MRGRPKKESARDTVFKVRLSAEEYQMLTWASELTGQSKSEVFREALLRYISRYDTTNTLTQRIIFGKEIQK